MSVCMCVRMFSVNQLLLIVIHIHNRNILRQKYGTRAPSHPPILSDVILRRTTFRHSPKIFLSMDYAFRQPFLAPLVVVPTMRGDSLMKL